MIQAANHLEPKARFKDFQDLTKLTRDDVLLPFADQVPRQFAILLRPQKYVLDVDKAQAGSRICQLLGCWLPHSL